MQTTLNELRSVNREPVIAPVIINKSDHPEHTCGYYIHSDRQLILHVAKGSEHAFVKLYNKYLPLVKKTLRRMRLRCSIAQDEICQDVFISLWISKQKLADVAVVENYIFHITRNMVLRYNQRRSKHEKVLLDDHMAQSNEDKFAEKELEMIYFKAIETLPPKVKQAYLLRYEMGLSTEQGAKKMKSNPRTVKNQHVKAKKIITAYIKQNI